MVIPDAPWATAALAPPSPRQAGQELGWHGARELSDWTSQTHLHWHPGGGHLQEKNEQ